MIGHGRIADLLLASRRSAPGGAAVVLSLSLLACAESPPASVRPNVLLVVLDTTRADRLSSYGYPERTSPRLDRLAAEGVLYESCIAPGGWTLPSHASLFTGLYPRDHKTTCENRVLAERFTTLAELLQGAGYRTGGFSNNVWVSKSHGMAQGFDEFHDVWRDVPRPGHLDASATSRRVARWIDERPDPDQPFFAFINYFDPHLPYSPPYPYDNWFLPDQFDPAMVHELRSWNHPREVGYILKVEGLDVSPEQFEILESQYDGEIAFADSALGELLDHLADRGLLDDTIVVVTSDHGEHFGDHELMDHKFSLYDVLLRVPLVVRYPPKLPQGVRVGSHVQLNDVFPTILDLCGIPAETPTGAKALPVAGDAEDGREYTFAEFGQPTMFLGVLERAFPGEDSSAFDRRLQVVRGRRYKYIWTSDDKPELYDLVEDPGELQNLAGTKPQILAEMHERLLAFRRGE